MENKFIQNITPALVPSALVQALVPVPGSPGNYQVAYVPKEVLGLPYKLFSANLTQAGTDAPVVTVLYNDTGITWTPVYGDSGGYFLDPDTTPDPDKVAVFCTNGSSAGDIVAYWRNDRLTISTQASGAPTNGILSNSAVEIRIYP